MIPPNERASAPMNGPKKARLEDIDRGKLGFRQHGKAGGKADERAKRRQIEQA